MMMSFVVAVGLFVCVVLLCVVGMLWRQRKDAVPAIKEPSNGSYCVLILTAAVGGGHVAAGRALQVDIEQAGHQAIVRDGMHDLSPSLDWLVRTVYASQLKHRSQSAAMIFWLTSQPAVAAAVRALIGFCYGYRLLQVAQQLQPDIVVSTYPLVTSALGYLRRRGKLAMPVVALIPDYGVHPLWVAPAIDLHLVASRLSAQLAERAGGQVLVARLPVAPAYRSALVRAEARQLLGLPHEPFIALIVGGAWGAGDLEGMTRHVARSGAYTIVVTGHNLALRDQLVTRFAAESNVHILGWTEEMRRLMAAADCILQNAGGMTCLEAMEARLPIVLFDPIRGHGEFNATIMEQARLASWPRTGAALEALLRSARLDKRSLPAPHREAAPAAAMLMLALAQTSLSEVAQGSLTLA
ncbi:MAG: glycosyltransferase [Herpetosiphonaceae bacterium]|nr:glycosyltransferase [Herpetosiphonaceae bacterium]